MKHVKKHLITIIVIITVLAIPLTLHWRVMINTWPNVVLIPKNINEVIELSLTLGLNFIRFREIIYLALDIISAIIIMLICKRILRLNNVYSIFVILPVILYFTYYPYNKLSDAGFQGIYVLMTLASALTIGAIVLSLTNLRHSLKYMSLIIAMLFLSFATIGQWDPRILLYPLVLLILIMLMAFTIAMISKDYSMFLSLLFSVSLLSLLTYINGMIRVKLAEAISPIVPLNLNAFIGKYDVYHLISGTSWIPTPIPKQCVICAFLLVSLILVLSIIYLNKLNSLYKASSMKKTITLCNMLILTYIIVLIFELSIRYLVKYLLTSEMGLIILNRFMVLRYLIIMFRVPRFMDFTNKVILVSLSILLAKLAFCKKDKAPKHNIELRSKIVKLFIIIFFALILLSANYILIDKPLIIRGATLNCNPNATILLGLPGKIIRKDFPIADWNKEKILLEAFIFGKIKVGSLKLYDDGIIGVDTKASKIIKEFNSLNATVRLLANGEYAIVQFNTSVKVGSPILVPQGLYLGSEAWEKGYVPIYLDQVIPRRIAKDLLKMKIPVIIYKDKNTTARILAVWLMMCGVIKTRDELKILVPSLYTVTFTPSLKCWSPGFIGDPHHGIFYEPRNYEYDYTYKLDWGVVQGRDVEKPLRIPFNLNAPGKYVVMIRVMSDGKGLIKFCIDKRICKYIGMNKTKNIDSRIGFTWIEVCSINLSKGTHLSEIYWFPKIRGKHIPTIYLNLLMLIPQKLWKKALDLARSYIDTHGVNLSSLSDVTKKPFIYFKSSKIYYPFLGKEIIMNITALNVSKEPLIFTVRELWGYPIKVSGKGVKDILLVPVDYVKTGILVIPQGNKLSLQLKEYQMITKPTNLLELIIIYLAIVSLTLILSRIFHTKSHNKSVK